jgi:glycosyltransferase involved in cell wall biosynthesis
MLRKARKLKADVYHLHDLQLNKIAAKIKVLPHKPILIYDVHEPNPITLADAEFDNLLVNWTMQGYARFIHHWELRKSKIFDLIITTEENVARKFRDHLQNIPVEIIYNYCNWTLQPTTESVVKKYDFIYTGGIRRRRGAMEMLQAIVMLREQGIKAKLLMVGPVCDQGLQEEMEQFIDKEALTKQVTLHPPVPYEQITEFYKASRCGLAFFDTKKVNHIIMPIKIFEYIAFGLPVICTGIGHMKRITEAHHTGITVEPGNTTQLAEAMKKLMTEDKFYKTLRHNCLNLYKTQFNWQQMEKKLLGLYEDLLMKKNSDMNPL